MADSIIIRPAAASVIIGGRTFTAFMKAGNILTTATTGANSTSTEALNGILIHVRTPSTARTVSLTLVQHHPDDAFLQQALKALLAGNTVLPIAISWGGVLGVSGNMDITQEPERGLDADAAPPVVWLFTGSFTIFNVIKIAAPTVLTPDAIAAA